MENKTKWNIFSIISFILILVLIAVLFPIQKALSNLFNYSPYPVLIWPLLSITMIVVNSLASKQARKMNEKGKGFAVAGIVLASILTLISIVITLASFAINL